MSESNFDSQWFKQRTATQRAQALFAYVRNLETSQSNRQSDNVRNMRLYGNADYQGLGSIANVLREQQGTVANRVTLNIVQSMVDTVTSKIGKNKPRPYYLTDNGDFTLKQRAKKLSQFAEGCFYSTDYYDKAIMAFQDACIFGTGAVKIYREANEIKAERVFIDELSCDDAEAYYGEPRQMQQRKWIHKDVLADMFPSSKSAIDAVAQDSGLQAEYTYRRGDMVLVVEAWKLPSGKNAKDGKHVICINNHELFSETWVKDYFPFVFLRWNQRPLGFWGQGIAEQLTGLQLEINKLLRTIQVSMHLVSVPKIYLEASSKVVSAHLDNKIGGIIRYAGTKPDQGALGTIPVELFTHVDRLYNRAYEIVGVSQMAAQAVKPAGLDSGKALRTFNDLESERFMSVSQRYEKSFLDASKIMVDIAKDIAADTGNYSVKVPGSGFLKTIKWEDVDMDEDAYILQVFPTSALSREPAARLQEVQELMQAGLVSKEDGMKLLDFPDLKAYYNMANAGAEDIERQIEIMMDEGEYETPEPFQNLQYGVVKMQQAYLMYRSQRAPEDRLELLRRWISDAKNLMDSAAAEAAAIAAPATGPALGVPAAPPVSDLQALPTAGMPVA
jgi:hypothetical protein